MTATKPKQPVAYSGSGSAIDNYIKPSVAPLEIKEKCDSWGFWDNKNPTHRVICVLVRNKQWLIYDPIKGELPDMLGKFSDFLKSNRSPVNKPLKKMTNQELQKIIVAIGGVIRHEFNKKLCKHQ